MPTIRLRSPEGKVHTVEARPGASVMETAVKYGVPGIVAECGGGLSCATCHVYVSPDFLEMTGIAEDFEDDMLDDTLSERQPNSRLSCQIRMTDELDGLEVTIAPEQ